MKPLADEDGVVKKLVAIQSDRSEAKKFEARLVHAKEAAEAADRAKSEFLAVMSHEVRTPLNAVIGFTVLLMDSQLSDQQRDYLKTIESSGESLLSLVNDILDFSRMEADKFILEKTHFDLRQSIESTLELLGAAAAKKGLELVCDLASETPETIYGDQARIKQVILNLAGNAVKFTDEGEVVISVRVVSKLGGAMRLRFEVRDTGPGIDLGHQQELFKPFSQADSTATRRHGGTGLGLAISKRLVKLMGGDIGLESSPRNGSTFWFELPTEVSKDRDMDFASAMSLRGQSVLLVEHNTSLRAVLLNQLTRWGMQVKGFSRGRDAVYAADQRRFDVAIIDTNTPDIEATRLAERLRRSPRGGVERIVVLEMPGRSIIGSNAVPAMIEVVRKPLRIGQLFDILVKGSLHAGGKVEAPIDSTVANSPLDPAKDQQSPESSDFTPEAAVTSNYEQLPRVLVADDNAVNRRLIAKMLTKMGYESAMAENGLEALHAVEESRFDVILMDLQMPQMDGLEATRQIRTRGFSLPIIAITADAMPDDQTRCATAGMNDYLSKPVRAAALEAALHNAMAKTSA
ncbi:MAG: response regulator [Chthoniobacterales bacterium]